MALRQFRIDDTSVWPDRFGNGSDGALTISSDTTDASANTTITGTSTTTAASVGSGTGFSDGNLVLIHQTQGTGAGNWELNKITSGATSTSWVLAYPLINTYVSGAQVIVLKQYTTVTVNAGVTWSARAWNGSSGGILAYAALQSATINGTISANIAGFRGGASGRTGSNNHPGFQGESATGTGTQSSSANGAGGGGGGLTNNNTLGGAGGGGGNGASGSAGANGDVNTGGTAGGTNGTASLITLDMGAGGGGGGQGDDRTGSDPGQGARGGGIIFILGTTVTIASTGIVTSPGGNAPGGFAIDTGSGGGGSGGSILIKAQSFTNSGSILAAGGSGATGFSGSTGSSGGVGRIHADYLVASAGSTTPTIDLRQDSIYADNGGGFLFNML